MYVGNRSKQNRREAEIESLQADIEDFEGSRKIILDDLLTGRNTHGLEWAWYCVSGGYHLILAFADFKSANVEWVNPLPWALKMHFSSLALKRFVQCGVVFMFTVQIVV
jgi:hypothetical protein